MNKIFYANGDSFVFGMECIASADKSEENKMYAFPKHVSDHLNAETYINNAYLGATNDFIFKNTIFDILALEKTGQDLTEVFVLIGWTSLNRIEIDGDRWYSLVPGTIEFIKNNPQAPEIPTEYLDCRTLFVNPSSGQLVDVEDTIYDVKEEIIPFTAQYLWTDNVQQPQQYARIIALHEFLKAKKCKHLFVNTVDVAHDQLALTSKNFYKLHSDSFAKYAVANHPTEQQEMYHFSKIPHEAYAKIIIDYIEQEKLS